MAVLLCASTFNIQTHLCRHTHTHAQSERGTVYVSTHSSISTFSILLYLFHPYTEVRDHGVAFYQFDKDTELRKQQMDKLAALREKVSI